MMTMIIITKMMMIIGSLNNDDVEDNENVEKANRFSLPNFKTNNFARGLSLIVYFVGVVFNHLPNVTFLDNDFWFFFLVFNLDTVL